MAKNIQTEEPKELEKIESSLTKAEQYVEDNQKKLIYIVGVLVLVIVGFFAYKNMIVKPKEVKAQNLVWQAQRNFEIDSFHIALYGNENVVGFVDILDSYSSTKVGNLANYYAGICYLRLGDYALAIEHLEDFSTEDPLLMPISISATGDAYSELEDYEKAADKYIEAAELADEAEISAAILYKAGACYEKIGDKQRALKVYTTIKEDYAASDVANKIDKYITRTSLK